METLHFGINLPGNAIIMGLAKCRIQGKKELCVSMAAVSAFWV